MRTPHKLQLTSFARLTSCAVVLMLASCSGGGGDDEGDGGSGGGSSGDPTESSQFVVSATTNSEGRATATIGIPAGVNRYSITAQSSAPYIRTEHVVGDDIYLNISGEFIALATEFQNILSTANVPSRDFDPVAKSGPVDVIVAAATDVTNNGFTPASNIPVEFVVTTKKDPDLRSGRLNVNIFRVGDAAVQADAAAAIDSAVSRMKQIYASQAGITVESQILDLAGPAKLPFPFDGGELYAQASAASRTPAVNIFVGAEIDLDVGLGTLLGVSASIPGPTHPTAKSAVAVSLVGAAGPDGSFSENETRILGETFAHESGHYLGLFHPIELDGLIGFFASGEDSLPDTETCTFLLDCMQNDNLAHNLMFPTPLPDDSGQSGDTIPQDRLTSQQRGVLNLNAIVD